MVSNLNNAFSVDPFSGTERQMIFWFLARHLTCHTTLSNWRCPLWDGDWTQDSHLSSRLEIYLELDFFWLSPHNRRSWLQCKLRKARGKKGPRSGKKIKEKRFILFACLMSHIWFPSFIDHYCSLMIFLYCSFQLESGYLYSTSVLKQIVCSLPFPCPEK